MLATRCRIDREEDVTNKLATTMTTTTATTTARRAFDAAIADFCQERGVVRPAKDADRKALESFASHFVNWQRERATNATEEADAVQWQGGCA